MRIYSTTNSLIAALIGVLVGFLTIHLAPVSSELPRGFPGRPADCVGIESRFWKLCLPEVPKGGEPLADVLGRTDGYPWYEDVIVVPAQLPESERLMMFPVGDGRARDRPKVNLDYWLGQMKGVVISPGDQLWFRRSGRTEHMTQMVDASHVFASLESSFDAQLRPENVVEAWGEDGISDIYYVEEYVFRIHPPELLKLLDTHLRIPPPEHLRYQWYHQGGTISTSTTHLGVEFPAGSGQIVRRDGDLISCYLIDFRSGWVYSSVEDLD